MAAASARHVWREHRSSWMSSNRSARARPLRSALGDRSRRDGSGRGVRRIKAMGGGIAIQNRLAFAGEYFVERYGKEAADTRRRFARCSRWASPSARAPTARAQQLQPLAVALLAGVGQDDGRHATLRGRQQAVTRKRCGFSPWAAPGSARRKTLRAASRRANTPTSPCSAKTTSLSPRSRSRISSRADAVAGKVVYARGHFRTCAAGCRR